MFETLIEADQLEAATTSVFWRHVLRDSRPLSRLSPENRALYKVLRPSWISFCINSWLTQVPLSFRALATSHPPIREKTMEPVLINSSVNGKRRNKKGQVTVIPPLLSHWSFKCTFYITQCKRRMPSSKFLPISNPKFARKNWRKLRNKQRKSKGRLKERKRNEKWRLSSRKLTKC